MEKDTNKDKKRLFTAQEKLKRKSEKVEDKLKSINDKSEISNMEILKSLIYTLENMSDGFVSLDKNWCYAYVNKKAGELLGRKPEDLIGKHIWTEFPEGIDLPFYKNYYKAVETQQPIFFEDYYPPWDRWFENRVFPSKNGLSIFFQDITDRKLAEEALRQSEERYRLMLNTALDGFILADEEGKIMEVNPSYCDMIGYSEQELLSMNIRDLEAMLSEQEIEERIQQMVSQGKARFETRHRAKDGHLIDLEVSVSIFHSGDKPLVAAFVRDITERKHTEEALQRSETLFRSIFEQSGEGISLADKNGNYVKVNPAFCKITGYSEEELLTMNVRDLVPPETEIELFPQVRNGKSGKREAELQRKDGSRFIAEINGYPIQLMDQNLILGIVRDITERKQAEEKLKASENRLKQAEEIAHLGHWELDLINDVLIWSDEVYRIFDLKPQEFEATYEAFLENIHPDDREKVNAAYTNSLKRKSNYEIEHRLLLKNGEIKYVLEKCKTEYDVSGRPIRSIGTVQDITERKRAEEELRKYREHLEELVKKRTEELQASNKELEAFAYSVSHDLRAPLRAIDGFTRILMEDYVEKLDDEGKRLGAVIRKNAQKMGKLIDDLLAFSRLGRASMQFSRIDMKNMVIAIYHELTSSSERERIEFSVGDLPDAFGDTNMLRQVWTNLISNAIKFSSKREKAIISITGSQDDEKTTYSISDNGVGFDMHYVNKIFDVFQRLHGETEFSGTGVGLSLVKRIIHRHNGEVWAESEIGQGSTFYFSLPNKGD